MTPDNEMTQEACKILRAEIQVIVNNLNTFTGGSRERALAITKLQEAKMWLGQELGNLGGEDLNAKRDREELATK